jgi:hypothetical protein
MFKKDSLGRIDTIQAPIVLAPPPEVVPVKANPVKKSSKPKVQKKINKKPAAKAKPSPEAIRKWKEKVAAQKALEKKKNSTATNKKN